MPASRLARSLSAGTVGGFTAASLGYWLPAIGLARIDYALWNGNLVVPDTTAVSFAWVIGALQTWGLSVLGTLVYATWLRGRLPGSAAVRGVLCGVVSALPAGLIAMPLLYDAGVFGLGWDGGLPVSLVLYHVVWGATLGLVYELEE